MMWGPRQPGVVSRAWNFIDVMVKLMTAEEAKGAVVGGLVYSGCKCTVCYRTPAPIIVYYFPHITCLLYLLFLIKHVQTSG